MTDKFLRKTKTLCRNGYLVEPTLDGMADVFSAYNQAERAKILNDWDSSREDGFDGDNPRETADNMALRMKLEARHQSLAKAGR